MNAIKNNTRSERFSSLLSSRLWTRGFVSPSLHRAASYRPPSWHSLLSTLAPHLQAITLPQGLPARDPQRRWAQAFGGTERLAYLGAERNRAPAARGLDRNRLLMRLRLRGRLSFLAGSRDRRLIVYSSSVIALTSSALLSGTARRVAKTRAMNASSSSGD